MAFIPVPRTVRVSLVFLVAGQEVVITISVGKGTDWTVGQIDDTLEDVSNWWNDNVKGIQTSDATLTELNGIDLSSDSAPSRTLSITSGNVGTAAGDPVANNVAAVTSFITALRGRSYRGRAYMPAIALSQTTSPTTWASGFAAALTALWAVLPSYFTVTGAQHVVASRYHNLAPRVTGVATPVISYRTDTLFDSQSRRLAGRGV